MTTIAAICQIAIAIVIFNVWILRRNRSTPYRPEGAGSLKEEFEKYGLPDWMWIAVGGAKLTLAVALLVGLAWPPVALAAAALMGLLMIGAVAAHIRVGDPWIKSMPAFLLFVLSAIIVASRVV